MKHLDAECEVLGKIEIDELVEFLRGFISIPSLGGNEGPAQEYIIEHLSELGLEVESWDMDFEELGKHPDFSMVVERNEGLGVIGTWKAEGQGRSLILNGHVDVVPAGDEDRWIHPPWSGTVDGGRVYGRGSVDMKGGIACGIYAVKAVIDSGVELEGDLIVNTTVGEEDGGVGALDAVLHGLKGDGAVVMEPSETCIVPAHAGACCFRITIRGRSAHACVREEGVDAIEKFYPIMTALRELERERNRDVTDPLYSRYRLPYAINFGRIKAGEWPGSVAEKLICEGRMGVAVDESLKEARSNFEAVVIEAARRDPWLRGNPPNVDWWGYQYSPARAPLDHPLISTLKGAARSITGVEPRVEGVTYASDMRHLVNLGGIPTVIFGPGDVKNAHTDNEFVSIEDLKMVTKTLALTILRFCGVKG